MNLIREERDYTLKVLQEPAKHIIAKAGRVAKHWILRVLNQGDQIVKLD